MSVKKYIPQSVKRALKNIVKLSSPAQSEAYKPASAEATPTPQTLVQEQPTKLQVSGPLLSVIIPSYNVEEYLEQCVESVFAQTYKNLEIIIVDDGAKDSTPELADALASRDDRVSVLHQPNGGLSNARNNGFRISKGEYVAFLDSDDWLPPTAYQSMMDALQKSGSDMATGNVTRVQGTHQWQAWNQSFTHVGVALTTTLEETPNLLFDATAWNKIYKRSLLEANDIQFPEGKLYEDMFPTARAFMASSSVDIVPENVYFYRIRDDNSSITQKRGELNNLVDKLEMIRLIAAKLNEEHLPEEASQVLIFKALEGDLPVYSPFLGSSAEFDDEYMLALRKYWAEASHETLAKLALDRRVLYSHQLNDDFETAAWSEAWVRNNFHSIPLIEVDGTIVADRSVAPEVFAQIPEDIGLDMSRYTELRQVVTASRFENGNLVLEGFAFIEYLPEGTQPVLHLELVGDDGNRIALKHEVRYDERADGYWGSGNASRANSGFVVRKSAEELFGSHDTVQEWTLWISVSAGNYSFTAPATGFWRGGISRLGTSASLTQDRAVYLAWQPWREPLRLRVVDATAYVTGVRQSGSGSLHLSLSSSLPVKDLELVRGNERLHAILEDSVGDSYVAHFGHEELNRQRTYNLNRGWAVEITSTAAKQRALLSPELQGGLDTPSAWQLRVGADGTARVVDQSFMLVAETLLKNDEHWVLTGICHYKWHHELTVSVKSDRGVVYECELSVDNSNRFEISIPYASAEAGIAWKPGEYKFEVTNTKWGKATTSLRCSVGLAQRLPIEAVDTYASTNWNAVTDTLEPSIRVSAPRRLAEKGRYNSSRHIQSWRDKEADTVMPMDAVFYSVDVGSGSGDSARAIFEEFRKRNPEWSHYWAVEDRSIPVPEGTIPVVRDTELWHEIVNRARVIVNNYGGLLGYNDWPHQYYVQTWHGTPLKTLGRSLALQGDPRWVVTREQQARREASEWDLFTAQNDFMASVAREEFFYEGEILNSGYPRNDSLISASQDRVEQLKSQLGIAATSRVLLYAPTWRDNGTGSFHQKLFEGLDLDELSRRLGDSWTILLRGHSFNKRAGGGDRSRETIIDVTNHADINELMLVADLLVTDYSSIMFDFMVTRKPIVYFAPDLEHYVMTRGMYFNFEDVLVGPFTQDIDSLYNELQQLDQFTDRFGEAYERQAERFVPWDDGGAAKRVVDRIMSSTTTPASNEPREDD